MLASVSGGNPVTSGPAQARVVARAAPWGICSTAPGAGVPPLRPQQDSLPYRPKTEAGAGGQEGWDALDPGAPRGESQPSRSVAAVWRVGAATQRKHKINP